MKLEKVRVIDPQWQEDALRAENEVLKKVFGDNPPIKSERGPMKEWTEYELVAMREAVAKVEAERSNT